MKTKKYLSISEGVWRGIVSKDFRIACCDCGLVHLYNFRVTPFPSGKGWYLENQGFRDILETQRNRRNRKHRYIRRRK